MCSVFFHHNLEICQQIVQVFVTVVVEKLLKECINLKTVFFHRPLLDDINNCWNVHGTQWDSPFIDRTVNLPCIVWCLDIKELVKKNKNNFLSTESMVFNRYSMKQKKKMLAEYLFKACQMCYVLTVKGTCGIAYKLAVANDKVVPQSWHTKNRLEQSGCDCFAKGNLSFRFVRLNPQASTSLMQRYFLKT